MTFGNILYTLLIGPLQLFFEVLYMIANRVIGNYGLSIIVLSLIMNFLVLPLYKRADEMQAEERDMEAKLHDGIAHIKKTFKGDERMMMLQTYYRQNDYRPTDVIKGSVSLFLEIPFFIAAYNFLSHLECIRGVSFGPIRDLGAQDGLLVVAGISINILPIIMTSVNLISCVIYTKGFPLKTKIQLYGMAIFFLFFLYTSPAGLVFYWTLNNIFSLVKTIFYKLKNPKKVLSIMASLLGIVFVVLALCGAATSVNRLVFFVGMGVLLQVPVLSMFLQKKNKEIKNKDYKPEKKVFVLGTLFLALYMGSFISSTFVKASPLEFVDLSYYQNPLWYVVSAFCYAIGLFCIWFRVFYWLADAKWKCLFEKMIWVIAGIAIVDYMFFGKNLGIIKNNLSYEEGLIFFPKERLINLIVVLIVAIVVFFVLSMWRKKLAGVMVATVLAIAGISGYNCFEIHQEIDAGITDKILNSGMASLKFSKEGKNVVVFMLDRGMGEYIPYIMNEKPELKEKFDGFTYYPNVVSFGGFTNFGTPGLYGGYEYSPVEMNKRDTELLVDKQNEALKIMPVIFDQNDFDVTVCDPTYANYNWVPDLSIYDDYPDIQTYITNGTVSDVEAKKEYVSNNMRNFFCFGFMKSIPLAFQETFYEGGNYNNSSSFAELSYSAQTRDGISVSDGIHSLFMDAYNVLAALPSITKIEEGTNNTFLMMSNDATHEPMLLQEPEYVPAKHVDNTEYDQENMGRFEIDGKVLHVDNDAQMIHYHANMASLIKLGEWFDYLRDNDVYDNTKIIIVSDHGRPLYQMDELVSDNCQDNFDDFEFYYPLLLVKDFDAKGFETSGDFMTNADVPTLAFDNVISNPINPFTGKVITNEEKYAHDQYILGSQMWDTNENNGYTFLPGKWYAIKDDIWNKENWTILQESSRSPFEQID